MADEEFAAGGHDDAFGEAGGAGCVDEAAGGFDGYGLAAGFGYGCGVCKGGDERGGVVFYGYVEVFQFVADGLDVVFYVGVGDEVAGFAELQLNRVDISIHESV